MAILEPRSRRRKLTAILHADVVGFSRLMGEDETGTHQALGELRRVVDPLITAHGGRIVGTAGDSLLADFTSVVDALNCAIEMQRAARAINDPFRPERRLELRIGVNLGDVIVDGDNIFGDGVNIAARLEALAQPGTTCISQTVYDHVKNIAEPVRAYAVGLPAKSPRPRRGRQPLIAAAAATIALMIAGLVAWEVYSGAGRALLGLGAAPKAVDVASLAAPNRLAGRTSVAVLPFKNLSGDAGQDYFSDGITEDVIGALGRFSSLLVAAKSASFQFKGRDIAPAEIGRALDTRYLLGGSVRRAGDRVRVNVELTDAETGRHLWSEAYDAELTDIFAVQDDIARRVVGAAAAKLTGFEQERVLTKPTSSLAAYEYLLRGRDRTVNATREQNDASREMFQRAIDLDPPTPPPMPPSAAHISTLSCRDGQNFAMKRSSAPRRWRRKRWRSTRRRPAPTVCSPLRICTEDVMIWPWGRSTVLSRSIQAMRRAMRIAATFWYTRENPARPCPGSKERFASTAPTPGQVCTLARRIISLTATTKPSKRVTAPLPATPDAALNSMHMRSSRRAMLRSAKARTPRASVPLSRACRRSSTPNGLLPNSPRQRLATTCSKG